MQHVDRRRLRDVEADELLIRSIRVLVAVGGLDEVGPDKERRHRREGVIAVAIQGGADLHARQDGALAVACRLRSRGVSGVFPGPTVPS